MNYKKNNMYWIERNRDAILIFMVSFFFAISANHANIQVTHLMYGSSDDILFGSTLNSPDNSWYLNQIKYFMNGFGFTIDPLDPIYAVRRTPGYPIFYGLHYIILGESGAHKFIPYTQTFLHSIASVYLYRTAALIFADRKIVFWSGFLYGISPLVISYLFMTITESIFPAIVIFQIYLSVLCFKKASLKLACYAGFILAVAVLVRPMSGLTLFFFISLGFYFKDITIQQIIKINGVFFITFFIAMAPWVIRNYMVLNKFVPLETYYLNASLGNQNIKSDAMHRWWSTWGSPKVLELHEKLVKDIDSGDPYITINFFINNEVPAWVYKVKSKQHLKGLLIEYQSCILKNREVNGGRRLRYLENPLACEYKVSGGFDVFANAIKAKNPFHAYFVAPFFIRGGEYVFHSAIHSWRSLDDYRKNLIKFAIKGFAYVINIYLWLSSIAYLIFTKSQNKRLLLAIVPSVSFIFIIYNMHVEGRYLIGVYPFLYLMSTSFFFENFAPLINKKFFNNRINI